MENGVDEFYTKGNESEEETVCKENGHDREEEGDKKEVKTTSSHTINNAQVETYPDDTAVDTSADDEAYHKDKVLKLR